MEKDLSFDIRHYENPRPDKGEPSCYVCRANKCAWVVETTYHQYHAMPSLVIPVIICDHCFKNGMGEVITWLDPYFDEAFNGQIAYYRRSFHGEDRSPKR